MYPPMHLCVNIDLYQYIGFAVHLCVFLVLPCLALPCLCDIADLFHVMMATTGVLYCHTTHPGLSKWAATFVLVGTASVT